MLNLIEALCNERGVPGDEGRVREAIVRLLDGHCDVTVDKIGNVIAKKPGAPGKSRLALFAHMDEVGLLVTRVTDEGLLRFSAIGIDPRVLHGRRVLIGDDAVPGAIVSKVWHHLTTAERDGELTAESLVIDIGAASKAEAEAVVRPGDSAVVDAPFCRLGDRRVTARALDDRVGCALLVGLLRCDLDAEITGVFTCGEESGLFGAAAAASAVRPDIAIILETTTAGDVEGASADKRVCALGKGPVVSFADRGALYDRELFARAFDLARQNDIPVQTKEGVFGGNEARVVQTAGDGARVLALSVPCRNLHSASCLCDLGDVAAAERLLPLLVTSLAAL